MKDHPYIRIVNRALTVGASVFVGDSNKVVYADAEGEVSIYRVGDVVRIEIRFLDGGGDDA